MHTYNNSIHILYLHTNIKCTDTVKAAESAVNFFPFFCVHNCSFGDTSAAEEWREPAAARLERILERERRGGSKGESESERMPVQEAKAKSGDLRRRGVGGRGGGEVSEGVGGGGAAVVDRGDRGDGKGKGAVVEDLGNCSWREHGVGGGGAGRPALHPGRCG
jgi:hypothetical protein